MKMEINGVQTELSVEEFVKLSEILESKPDESKEVSGYEIARGLIDELLVEEEGADLPERFSVGDVVMIDDCIDDVGVVVKDDKSVSLPYKVEYLSGETEWCYPDELHRLEGEELAEYNRDHIGEGHIVVIIDNTNYSANIVGDIGKVINRDLNDSDSVFVKVPGGLAVSCYTGYADMRLATEDERQQYEESVAELAEEPSEEAVEEPAEEPSFKVGAKVRVIVPSTEDPAHGWGDVTSGDVGVVAEISPDIVYVDFESTKGWWTIPSELELFDEDADLPAGTTIKSKYTGKVYTIEKRLPSMDGYGHGKAYNTTNGGWSGMDQVEVLNVPLAEPTPTESEHVIEVGDIVQVTEYMCGHPVGTIGVVESVDSFGGQKVSAVYLEYGEFVGYEEENVKLIAKHYDRKDV